MNPNGSSMATDDPPLLPTLCFAPSYQPYALRIQGFHPHAARDAQVALPICMSGRDALLTE